MVSRRYKVVICKKCGHMQITYAEKCFQCFRCGELIKLDQSIILYETPNPSKAREKLVALKTEIQKLKREKQSIQDRNSRVWKSDGSN